MKCEKCGKELGSLEVDMFDRDGSDDWYDVEINEDHGVVIANVTPEWTGDGLSEEEYHETIRCPHCRQFPFIDKFVDATTFISLVMYPKAEGDCL